MGLEEELVKQASSSAVTGICSVLTKRDTLNYRNIIGSMGGLLIADTLIAMASSLPDPSVPLWPKIIAVIAFDTPVRP
jgi:hypothetical protein